VTVDDFKIPDPPANSSEQTRKEIGLLACVTEIQNGRGCKSEPLYGRVYYNLRVRPGDSTYARYRKKSFSKSATPLVVVYPETLPVTADSLQEFWQDASYFIWALKFSMRVFVRM